MAKTIRVTLELVVANLSGEDRAAAAREIAEFDDEFDGTPPSVDDYSAAEIAEVLTNIQYDEELFTGSLVYAQFTDCKVICAEFVDEKAQHPESGS